MIEVRFRVSAKPAAVAEARHRMIALEGVPDALGDLPDSVVADAGLVLSELVTNSIRHAGLSANDMIEIALRREDRRLVIEVDDRDGLFAQIEDHPRERNGGGMGFKLLDALCDHWQAHAGHVVAAIAL